MSGLLSRRQVLVGMPLLTASLVASRSSLARNTPSSSGIQSLPFQAGSQGYTCFRTPGLAITGSGVLLAFCGGRVENCKDDGDHDVVLRRSLDGGRTWGPIQVIANDRENRCDIPVPVVLPSGRVLLLWVWNAYVRREEDRGKRQVMVCHSDDDGLTWSAARDITHQVRLPGWKSWYGIGPGHGFTKQLAPAAGRVIVPARHSEPGLGSQSHLIISDDGGISWRVGAQAMGPNTSSEATACELGNGGVMINSRGNLGYRLITLSPDGGISASQTYVDQALIETANGCQGSLLTYSINTVTRSSILLFSNPVHPQERTNGRIRVSRDNGRTWSVGYPYQHGPESFTGYSDLARFSNGDVAILFESGQSYRKGQFADAIRWELPATSGNGKVTTKKGREKREGRTDNRHDGISFRRIPFMLLES